MKIYLHEITEQETELDFSEEDTWALDAVTLVDEAPAMQGGLPPAPKPSRAIDGNIKIRRVDDVIILDANIETDVRLLCSRCATPFSLKCTPKFTALFCQDAATAGMGHLFEGRPNGQNHGKARHEHDATDNGLDITYISDDFIDLAAVITEQLRLQMPLQPLCKQECNGICHRCGTDLNAGRCACAKLEKQSPFSVLKDLNLKS
jgi:uncharacterized protein